MATRIKQVTESGEVHGLIENFTNSVPFNDFITMSPTNAEEMRKRKADDSRVTRVKYLNRNGKHERLDKHYCRYAGDPIQKWHLVPGYVYELPMGLVKEVNGQRQIKRAGLQEVDGNPVNRDSTPLEKDQYEDAIHMHVPVDFVFLDQRAM